MRKEEGKDDIRALSRHRGAPGETGRKDWKGVKTQTGPTHYIHNMARPDAMKVEGGGGGEPNVWTKSEDAAVQVAKSREDKRDAKRGFGSKGRRSEKGSRSRKR